MVNEKIIANTNTASHSMKDCRIPGNPYRLSVQSTFRVIKISNKTRSKSSRYQRLVQMLKRDQISPERTQQAGLIKDLSAAAVLFASITSLVIGAIIFIPKLLELV